jgi:hypothetical protein
LSLASWFGGSVLCATIIINTGAIEAPAFGRKQRKDAWAFVLRIKKNTGKEALPGLTEKRHGEDGCHCSSI